MTFIDVGQADPGLPNSDRAYAHRPDVRDAWDRFLEVLTTGIDPRRYELATLAAARRLRSSYCMLAHGSVLLRDDLVAPDQLRALVRDHRAAGLDADDVAVMDLADKVVTDATSITQADIDAARQAGLSDAEIFDVVLAAAARCFMSKVLDAVGAQPDAGFGDELEPSLLDALTVGRPLAGR